MLTESTDTRIRMSFFEASDGPRIMLFGPLGVNIAALQNLFRKLSREVGEEYLDKQPFIVPFGDLTVLAKSSGSIGRKIAGKRQGLVRLCDRPLHFEWIRSSEGWDYLAELIDGLMKTKQSGHQYLTRYPDEDAIVVVSKGEYSDSIVST